jgi:protein-disulfide isomerase
MRLLPPAALLAAAVVATPLAAQQSDSPLAGRGKGVASAPVTVYEMSDFQCPYCRRFALETFPVIEREYISSGKVRWMFVNFPLTSIHPNAVAAAEVALCSPITDDRDLQRSIREIVTTVI